MAGKRYALVIATTTHDIPGIAPLSAPSADAREFAELLEDSEIGSYDVETVMNSTSAAAEERVEAFLKAPHDADDVLLLYFTGHGITERGQLYFAMTNTRRDRLRSTSLPAQFVQELLSECNARTQVVILDSCFSGAFPAE